MPLVLRPPTDAAPPLTATLGSLGRSRRRARVAGGAFALAAAVVAAVVAACVLDAAVHLPAVVRAVLLACTLAAAGVLFARWVRTPAGGGADPLAVALLLEARYPKFADALASAVEFQRPDAAAGGRPAEAFRRSTVKRAVKLLGRSDPESVVPTGRAWRAFGLAVLAGLAAAGLLAADPGRASTALARFADPFGSHPWPTATTVRLLAPESFPTRMAKGDPFDLRFVVRGVVPPQAVVSVRLAGGGGSEDVVPLSPPEATPGEAAAAVRLDPSRVPRDFEVRVVAHDADTGWQRVTVAPPPKLVPLDGRPSPQLRLDFPDYTGLPPVDLPDGTGVIECVAGTRVTLRAAADRRIAAATLRNQADLTPLQVVAATAFLAAEAGNAFGTVGGQLLADSATADVVVTVSGPEGRLLAADFRPAVPGLYALRFADETGLAGVRLFDLRVYPDPAPVVMLNRPAAGADPLTVLPTGTVTVDARADDPLFAVRRLFLEYRVGAADGFAEMPLADATAVANAVPAVVGSVAAAGGPLRLPAVGGGRVVPVAALRKPDGSPPADGDVIALRAAADDFDDVTALKAPGRSKEVEIRVLSRPSIEAEMQNKLAGLRPDLRKIAEQMKEARQRLDAAADRAEAGKLTADERDDAAKNEQALRQIRGALTDPRDGVLTRAEQLRDTARANDLPATPVTEKADAVAKELRRLADQYLDPAEPLVAAARQQPDAKQAAGQMKAAGRLEKGFEEGTRAVLERLEQWGGAGEVRGEARAVRNELNRTDEEARKAGDAVPAGKSPDQLAPQEKGELGKPAGKLDEAAEQAAGVMAKAGRIAAAKEQQAADLGAAADAKQQAAEQAAADAGKQPAGSAAAQDAQARADRMGREAADLRADAAKAAAEAKALGDALQQAGGQAVAEDLKRAADALRNNRQGESAAARQAALDRRDKMTDALAERRDETADQLQKKLKDAGDEVDKLADAADELRKKTNEAAAEPDPAKRAEAMSKLAREEARLKEEAEQLAERLTRDRADPAAAEAVRQAAEKMDAARQQLEQGNQPAREQQDALDKLDEAKDKLDEQQDRTQDTLAREKREQLQEQLKAFLDRQKAAVEEAGRIQDVVVKAQKWERPLLASLDGLEQRERGLAEELRSFAGKNLAELKVFDRMARQAADGMDRGGDRIRERKDDALANLAQPFDAEVEKVADESVRRPMRQALRRLEQVMASLKDDPKKKPPAQQGGGGEGGGGGGGGGGAGGEGGGGLPPLAQLKALREWQADVNERTREFAQAHPDPDKLGDADRDELRELEQAQRDIAELFQELLQFFQPQAPDLP